MKLIPSFSVSMDISDLLYVSYLIHESKVRPYIPAPLIPARFRDEKVFLSIVSFRSKNVMVAGFPFLRFAYDQINIRTYVKNPETGKDAVLFLFSGIASPFVAFSANILGFPWKNIPFELRVTRNDTGRYSLYEARGAWKGAVNIIAEEDLSRSPHSLPPDVLQASSYITSPAAGYYKIGSSLLGFAVEHTRINPRLARTHTVEFPFLASTGLVEDDALADPECILLAEKATFTIFLPPHRAKTHGKTCIKH